ncbi:MAG TPA: MaoC/PaaZ C-terminal domain-containing protein [Acidimicrobiia bacterium]|nr:MaoC/PaaZ C-terminal domain-containing protein [Acidimicrobiia bacterium]
MTIEALEGRVYADRPYRLCREKIDEFVDVTGDERERWTEAAPPGFAAALLFVVAPDLLVDPLVKGAVIHGEQTFTWRRPLVAEAELLVSGTVDRVRTRSATSFVTFSLAASDPDGQVLSGRSTFLVGDSPTPPEPAKEVDVHERAANSSVSRRLPSPRSASRADLVRYAAATRDWNPIHWDRASAIEAGLGGVVVHGLLQSAWLTQVAATVSASARPLESARFRYTAPLRPAELAEIQGELSSDRFDLTLVTGDVTTVLGRFEVAP